MQMQEVQNRLKENGIMLPVHTIRRRIDKYIDYPTRIQANNHRDITAEEFRRLQIAIALEIKGISAEAINNYLTGLSNKADLTGLIVDSQKIDYIIKKWIED